MNAYTARIKPQFGTKTCRGVRVVSTDTIERAALNNEVLMSECLFLKGGDKMAQIVGLVAGIFVFCCLKAINPDALWMLIGATSSGSFLATIFFKVLDEGR